MRFASILLLALVGLGLTTAVAPASRLNVSLACGVANPAQRSLCYSWGASPTADVVYVVRTRILNKVSWVGLTDDPGGAVQQSTVAGLSHALTFDAPAVGDSLIVRAEVWAVKGALASDTIAAQFVLKRIEPAPAPPSSLVVDSLP
jgi:hypothetical protein